MLKAYGRRQIEPDDEAMTVDTVFDMASLTKPIATATSIMMLVERGEVRLRNPVAEYIPEFGQNGKDDITVEDLLVHRGGLIPDNSLKDYQDGAEKSWERIFALKGGRGERRRVRLLRRGLPGARRNRASRERQDGRRVRGREHLTSRWA